MTASFEDSLPPPPQHDPETPYSLPLAHPNQDSKPVAPKPLSAEQQDKLDRLVQHFNRDDFRLPRTLKALKARWQQDAGGASRIGSFFGRSATASDQEVRTPPTIPRPQSFLRKIKDGRIDLFCPASVASCFASPQMSDLHGLSEVEKCYWSSQAFQRCLRATKWDYAAALKRAEETCVWRREFRVEEMKEEDVWKEGETGKELVFGYDVNCRPVLYMVSRPAADFRGRN